MDADTIIANLKKQKAADEDFIVSKVSNFHVVTKSKQKQKTTYYFSENAHAEIFLVASVTLSHIMKGAKAKRLQDFSFGFCIETNNDKVTAVGYSPVIFNLMTDMELAVNAGQDCAHELVKYIA